MNEAYVCMNTVDENIYRSNFFIVLPSLEMFERKLTMI